MSATRGFTDGVRFEVATEQQRDEVVASLFNRISATSFQQDVKSSRAIDALLVYRGVLEATADVFGKERMTDAVMAAAIEAGSYAMWRTVMGGKFPENDQEQQRPRRVR